MMTRFGKTVTAAEPLPTFALLTRFLCYKRFLTLYGGLSFQNFLSESMMQLEKMYPGPGGASAGGLDSKKDLTGNELKK